MPKLVFDCKDYYLQQKKKEQKQKLKPYSIQLN